MTKQLFDPAKWRFALGQVVCTPGVKEEIDDLDMVESLHRHATGDWGLVDRHDQRENDRALKEGERLLSAYESAGTRFWIITEWDRSVTTILLPEEY